MTRIVSPRYGVSYADPTLRDEPADVPADIKRVVDGLELSTRYGQGILSSRPAAAIAGRIYYATDVAQLYWDTGSAWVIIGPPTTDSIQAVHIAANAIGTSEIADGSVTSAKIATDSITAANIAADAVGASELANNAVDTNAVINAAITGAKIGTDTITAGNIAPGAIGNSELGPGTVALGNLADGILPAAGLYLDTSGINPDAHYRDAGAMNFFFNTNSTYLNPSPGEGVIWFNTTGLAVVIGVMQLNLPSPHGAGYACCCTLSGNWTLTNGTAVYEAVASPGGVNYNQGLSSVAIQFGYVNTGYYVRLGGWTNWSGSVSFRLYAIRLANTGA